MLKLISVSGTISVPCGMLGTQNRNSKQQKEGGRDMENTESAAAT
jgi:hypothetical protein